MTSTISRSPDDLVPGTDGVGLEAIPAPRSGGSRTADSPADVRRPARRTGLRRLLSPSVLALIIVTALSTGLVALHIQAYQQLSVYDEPHHVDFVNHLLQGTVPKSGDVWLAPTIDSVACRTIDYPMSAYPPCGGPATQEVLPNQGLMTAFIHSPLYYTGPAAAVWIADQLSIDVDSVSVMRATGALWLAVALGFMWLLWRELSVPWATRAGLALLLVASPVVLMANSTVTNDATGLAAGAAVTLLALRWDARRASTWLALTVAVVALLLKTTTLLVLILASVFVLVRCLQRADLTTKPWWQAFSRRSIVLVGGFAVASAVVGLGWSMFENARATLDPRAIPQVIVQSQPEFDPSWLPGSLLKVVTPLEPQFLQSALQGTIGAGVGALVNVAVLALAIVGAVRATPGSSVRALAIATAVAALAFPPILTLMNYQSLGIQFSIPARYGLTLVPAMLAIGGTVLRSRPMQIAVVAAGVLMYAAIAFRLLG